MSGPQAAMIGRRLHLQHGPIDLIIEAWGSDEQIKESYRAAHAAFKGVLEALCEELGTLRAPVGASSPVGPVARRMFAATSCHDGFITPMAAVAGSVADHVLAAMRAATTLDKIMVNNGGDIALWMRPSQTATIAVGDTRDGAATLHPIELTGKDGIGGIATSGWRGRSYSLGIADFVTVFAVDAATADAAATVIANAVDLPGSGRVKRERADTLSPDSDLGARLVTVDVAPLADKDVSAALAAGRVVAEKLLVRGVIAAAILGLQDMVVTVGGLAQSALPELQRRELEEAS